MRLVTVKNLTDYYDERYAYSVKFNNEDKAVSKHFDSFADLIGRLRFKEFNIKTGEWIITQNGYEAFKLLDDKLFNRKPKFDSIISDAEKNITDYAEFGNNLKFPLYEYQKQIVKFAAETKNVLIVAPCGAGKTPVGLSIYLEAIKSGEITGCGLIVVKASLKTQWLMEVGKFTDFRAKIIQTHSTVKDEKIFREQFENADLFILNYETLRDKFVRKMLIQVEYPCYNNQLCN